MLTRETSSDEALEDFVVQRVPLGLPAIALGIALRSSVFSRACMGERVRDRRAG